METLLPATIPEKKGYEALIGMLNWVLPLDYSNSLKVLLESLYTKVTKEYIQKVQTPEYVEFRTRIASEFFEPSFPFSDLFPFDKVLMSPLSKETGAAAVQKKDSCLPSKDRLIFHGVKIFYSRKLYSQTYKATFDQEQSLERIQIYFKDQQTHLFKVNVLVSSKGQVLSHLTLTESAFARLTRYRRSGQS